jgi:hypothetical protein
MSRKEKGYLAGTVSVAICLALITAGCGGGGSSSSIAKASGEATASAQFLKPGGANNSLVRFGHEASAEEREEVQSVVTASLRARAAADFVAQCETLSIQAINEIPGAKGHGDCPRKLKEFAEPLARSKPIRANTLSGPIPALRVKGDRAYALYHGNDGKDYALPLAKEDGAWKVSSLLTIEL